MERDTDIGGHGSRFPATHRSAVLQTRDPDPEVRQLAFSKLVESYWKPIYKYVRIKWRATNEEAKDLTQGFFTRAMEKGYFQRYEPAQAKFRTFLRTCLDGYVANERKAARRIKRAGDRILVSLDFATAEGELRQYEIPDGADIDTFFHQEWVRGLFGDAVERLRQRCDRLGKTPQFKLFERYDLVAPSRGEALTYEALAREYELPKTQVTNYLAWARREFRGIVLERLREITGSDEEFRAEARELLGVEPE